MIPFPSIVRLHRKTPNIPSTSLLYLEDAYVTGSRRSMVSIEYSKGILTLKDRQSR